MEFHENMAIHCKNEKEAKELLFALKEIGYKWPDSDITEDVNYHDCCGEGLYYFLEIDKTVLCGHAEDLTPDFEAVEYSSGEKLLGFYVDMAIHCPEYNDAKKLLAEMEKSGYRWASGEPLSSNDIDFYAYGRDTFLFIDEGGIAYGSINCLDGYKTYEYSDGRLRRITLKELINKMDCKCD